VSRETDARHCGAKSAGGCDHVSATCLSGVREVDDHTPREAAAHGAGGDHLHLLRVLGIPGKFQTYETIGVIASR
jgi:hypothetical protein